MTDDVTSRELFWSASKHRPGRTGTSSYRALSSNSFHVLESAGWPRDAALPWRREAESALHLWRRHAGDWLPTSSPPGSGSCGSLSLSKWPPACSHSGESHWCWQARLPPGDSQLPPCCPLQPGTQTQQMDDRELNTHFRSDHGF